MGSIEALDFRANVAMVGELVYDRFESGDPLKVQFCGPPEIIVDFLRPLELEIIDFRKLPKCGDFRFLNNNVYPLATVIPLKQRNRTPGAAMVLKSQHIGLVGIRICPNQLNEIARSVGVFSEFGEF